MKRGPKRLSVRQLCNIEFILSVIEGGKSYPYDFVLHALTGFHPAWCQRQWLLQAPRRGGDSERIW